MRINLQIIWAEFISRELMKNDHILKVQQDSLLEMLHFRQNKKNPMKFALVSQFHFKSQETDKIFS